MAEGGVWGERMCFQLEAPGTAGPGPEGRGAAAAAGRVAEVRVVAKAMAGACWVTAAQGHLEGGGCHQCLTVMQALKQKKCLVVMREGAMVPSRSSNMMTNDSDDLGWNRQRGLTHEGN